ncbi:membrane-spanning 4-domains subfamily A member 8-like [Acanthaster planci]|uniref:Membrane-spanning 4-domains subfamily A member 8-like n=1 Tax=Acanthaster planci TaxID=133434 RepID=A0A8B7YEK8_ACAPL|nr:membrane-spanning 4-domains subfamily A member 8-like [Acanthaster planci]XP_022091684.1 membrane-spanning 4-domains subfamily A member 8-like [Acanthaster planci]
MEHQAHAAMLNPNSNSSLPNEPSPVHQPNTGVSSVTSSQGAPCPAGPPMVSQQYMVMIQNATGVTPDFNVRGAYMTAHLQIICGALSVILGIIAILIESEDAYIGAPIWTGIFFFMSAGLTGEFAAKKRHNCLITGYLVLSVLSSVAAFQLLSLMASFTAWEFGTFYSSRIRARVAVDALTAVVALLELGISIVAAVISCRGTCCQTASGPSMTVQYMPAVPNGGTNILQNEQGGFVQGQPIQVTTCSPGQVACQLQACPVPQPSPPPRPHAQQHEAYPSLYPSMEDSGNQLEDTENDHVTGMEKVPLV